MLFRIQQHQSFDSFITVFQRAKTVVSEAIHFHFYGHSLNNYRVLIVDGHVDTCDLFALVLEEAGAEVTVANSCEKALIQIQKNPPDVLISEIELPGDNGLILVRKAKELMAKLGKAPAMLAVTSYVEFEEKLEITSSGFHRHLGKPVDIDELVDVVSELIQQKPTAE